MQKFCTFSQLLKHILDKLCQLLVHFFKLLSNIYLFLVKHFFLLIKWYDCCELFCVNFVRYFFPCYALLVIEKSLGRGRPPSWLTTVLVDQPLGLLMSSDNAQNLRNLREEKLTGQFDQILQGCSAFQKLSTKRQYLINFRFFQYEY